ncbi:MAG: succinylglutamate desuccinylase/aspartoacylase family protein [Acetobacteraceae bacterium]|nr:succinylglutamate desuccinylase/aspartoacylase family protein [Acetobacteraceae bacterium]MCX7684647.1 succinylglutamate desuccinylase/aspartoacylase family protein [Acetobacteraceae bacterium]
MRLSPPDLRPWLGGGLRGVVTRDSGLPGPHAALVALMHGNEIAGAVLLDSLLREGLSPARGRLSFVFANLDAFARFDAADPTASRFLEEDMNRLWAEEVLAGPPRSLELRRAQELLPFLRTVDLLLDLHSMLLQPVPILLAGRSEAALALAREVGVPSLVVADQGHPTGLRLLDHPHFARGPARALLLEAGLHWEPETVAVMREGTLRFLAAAGLLPPMPPPPVPARVARVTDTIVPASHRFAFVARFRGGEVIAEEGTLLATDGEREIRTPYPDCLLVMPALRPVRGHTAVRLARFA